MGQFTFSNPFTAFRSHWREFTLPTLPFGGGALNSCFFFLKEKCISKSLPTLNFSFCSSPYRSGGHFGRLEIIYSTSDIDVVASAQADGKDLLAYYHLPKAGVPSSAPTRTVNVSGRADPLAACAAACLRELACQAFSLHAGVKPPACTWVSGGAEQLRPESNVETYEKNGTAAAVLFSARAVAGSDYSPVTARNAFMDDGSGVANLSVPILTDKFPEMDESFGIQILKVNLRAVCVTNFAFVTLILN